MATANEFEVRDRCERLIYRFLRVLEGEQGKTADLFTEDGQAFKHVGREAIREHFAGIEAVDDNVNVNLCSNLLIDVDDDDHARATNYVTHYVAEREAEDLTDPEGARVGGKLDTARSITRWSWEFRRVDGEWLISKLQYPEPVLLRKDVIDQL
ncbi:MAG: nuclear transport factor 2 family protein [Gammaproteobacteria bacterium]|nr:nuclear transport factor 2 family protein [Gammaproteobacteria bacterium]